MNVPKLAKDIIGSDVVIATVAILTATTLTAALWFFLAWLSYEKRYGITLADFIELSF